MAMSMPASSGRKSSAAVRLAALCGVVLFAASSITGFAGGSLQGQPRACRPVHTSAAVSAENVQAKEADLIADAVSSAVYKMWASEYPISAAAGMFQGRSASRDDIVARVQLLQEALQLSWTQVLGFVKADSTVLFAGSVEDVRSAFAQLVEELGSREAAVDVLRMQPALLLVRAASIEGKGSLIEHVAQFSDATRPIYRLFRQISMPAMAAPVLPKPLELAVVGLY